MSKLGEQGSRDYIYRTPAASTASCPQCNADQQRLFNSTTSWRRVRFPRGRMIRALPGCVGTAAGGLAGMAVFRASLHHPPRVEACA